MIFTPRKPAALPKRLLLAGLCLLVGALAVPDVSAGAHDDGIDLTISPAKHYTQRFSWLHWWETQRASAQRFSSTDKQAQWSLNRLAQIEPHREQLIEALVPIAKGTTGDPYARAGAITALARMQYDKLVEIIVSDDAPAAGTQPRLGPSGQSWPVGSVGDESDRVRVAGWLALGILDTEDSRARLTDEFVWAVTINDEIARVTAFGLLKKLSDEEREFLITTMRNSKTAEVQRMALWALSQHDTKDNDPIIRDAIRQLISPYSVAQAFQATDSMQRLKTTNLLQMVIDQPDKLDELTVFNHIERGTVWQSTCTFGVETELTVSALLALMEIEPATGETGRSLRKALVKKVEEGPAPPESHDTQSYGDIKIGAVANYDRGPAALALAMQADANHDLNDHIRTLTRLLEDGYTKTQVLEYPLDQKGQPCKDQQPVWVDREMDQHDHPARGYAAIAMGLMLQRMNPDTELGKQRPLAMRSKGQRQNVMGDLTRPLIKDLENTRERTEIRAAVAIAMGLSGYDQFREPLRAALTELDAGDAALYGYIVEALAMLDDPEAPKYAQEYLRRADQIKNENDRLTRRALASALIFSSHTDDETDKLIIQAWPHDPWVGLSLARASAVRGNGEMIDYLLTQLDDPQHTAAAAISLAEVVDPQDPWRLSSLTDDMNYTLDYRTPVELSWNPYTPGDQEPLPTRLVAGFDNPYLMHVLLMKRLPVNGTATVTIINDDSNGQTGVMFRPSRTQASR